MTQPTPEPFPPTLSTSPAAPAASAGAEATLSGVNPEIVSNFVPTGSSPLPPPTVPGYEVEGVLGRGGMGIVYRARHLALNRIVALKMIRAGAGADEGELLRFKTEAEAAARLHHPNVVQVYEVGEVDGSPFCALEFVEGGALDRRLAGTPQPPREAAALMQVLAAAVHAAHQRGIIHRDLKPANVLLGDGGAPKVADFGLAKQLDADSGQTKSGQVLGTPSYMCPEQAAGHLSQIGPPADVYALGAILYECLTGRPPFKGANVMDTLQQVCEQEPVPVRRLQPKVPRDLETICLKCLHKEPARRYASAQALGEDLGRFLGGEPIRARPVGAWERARKWAWRHPAAAALVAVSAVAAAALLAGGLYFDTQLQHKLAAVRAAQEEAGVERAAARQANAEARINHYLGRITRAERALALAHVDQAEQALAACPEDLRNWEWHYLAGRCRGELLSFHVGADGVNRLAFSPDGALLATGGGRLLDLTGRRVAAHLWDAATGRKRFTLPNHLGQELTGLSFSPDGQLLAATSVHQDVNLLVNGRLAPSRLEVKVWDTATGRRRHTLSGVGQAVAFSRDGRWLVTGNEEVSVTFWDTATWQPATTLPRLFGNGFGDLALSPDGRRLATASRLMEVLPGRRIRIEAEVRIWVLGGGGVRPGPIVLPRYSTSVAALAFSPAGDRLAVCNGNDVILYDTGMGRRLRTLVGHGGTVNGAAFSRDGRFLASAANDRTVRVWDPASGRLLYTLRGHADAVHAVAFRSAADAVVLASGSADGAVKLWDAARGQEALALRGHTNLVYGVVFNRDGRRLVSSSADGTVRVWDTRTGQPAGGPIPAKQCRLALSPDGRLVAGADNAGPEGAPGVVTVWDVATGEKRFTLPAGHTHPVSQVAFSPDGTLLASVSNVTDTRRLPPRKEWKVDGKWKKGVVGEVIVWDLRTRRARYTLNGFVSVAFSPDGRLLAAPHPDNTVRVYDAAEGAVVRTLAGHRLAVKVVAFSPDGRHLASGDTDNRVFVWDLETGTRRFAVRDPSGNILGLSYSRDGSRLASATFNFRTAKGEVRLWDARTGDEIVTLPGTFCVAFSPDGLRLAAMSAWDPNRPADVRIWDATPRGK